MRGSETEACRCPLRVAERYAGRISGPLRDRVDLWVEMGRVPPLELVNGPPPEASAGVAARIALARRRQRSRGVANAQLAGRRLHAEADLTTEGRDALVALSNLDSLSARGTDRLLRVARTIADLAEISRVEVEHLEEAARFRRPARNLADNVSAAR